MEGNHENLPDPDKFDELHRVWRLQVVDASGALGFTHGVAAKLINCYLKAAMVNRHTVSNPKVKAIHPPIDRILLTNLKKYRGVRFLGIPVSGGVPAWSTLNSDQYEKLIQRLREFITEDGNGSDRGLWELERYWWIA